MSQKKQFSFAFALTIFFSCQIWANHQPLCYKNETTADICTLPAPDSFRVAGRSGNTLSLAWKPVSGAASYTLEVFSRPDSLSSWELIYANNSVTGATYDLLYTGDDPECKLRLSANCTGGEASENGAELDLYFIIDMVIGGYVPSQYKIMPECSEMDLKGWVGFSVKKLTTGDITYFQVTKKPGGGGMMVHRIEGEEGSILVGSDFFNNYPQIVGDIVTIVGSPMVFQMNDVSNPSIPIPVGGIRIEYDDISIVRLCFHNDPINWKPEYLFSPLYLKGSGDGNGGLGLAVNNQDFEEIAYVDSYMIEKEIDFEYYKSGLSYVSIYSVQGQILKDNLLCSDALIQLEKLPNGIYFFKMNTKGAILTKKVFKG